MGFREEEGEESRERQEGKGTEGPEEGVEDMRAGKEEQAQEVFFCGVCCLTVRAARRRAECPRRPP